MKLPLIVLVAVLPLTALADPKVEAQKHIANATEAHQQGQFDVALAELETAYTLDPQPDLLYAIGQVQVKLGSCQDAIGSYERFLATNPGQVAAAAATAAPATCRAQLSAAAPPEPPPVEPEPAPPPSPPPGPEGRPWYTDKVGGALVGAGLVSGVIGIVLYSSARGTLDDAEAAMTYQEHADLVDSARTKRAFAVVLGVVGAAAIGGGVYHYLHYQKAERARLSVAPTQGGAFVAWTGRF
jgi:tetratricopeptide (TPR) repeat protein